MSLGKDISNLSERVACVETSLNDLSSDVKDLKGEIMGRVPIWVTVALALLTSVIGWLTSVIIKH